MLPAFIFGASSGAHFNPALTVALAAGGYFRWTMVPGYCIAQMAGAFVGACLVYVLFKDQFDATDDPDIKRGVFCTSPAVPDRVRNLISEIIGTFVLVFAILGLNQVPDMPGGVNYLLVFGIIVSIGMSLGGLTGYASIPHATGGPAWPIPFCPSAARGLPTGITRWCRWSAPCSAGLWP